MQSYSVHSLNATREVGEELSTLMFLYLPVLHRRPSKMVIQLHSLEGSHSSLILSSLCT